MTQNVALIGADAMGAAVDTALASPVRMESRTATEALLARFFTGRVHHHLTTAYNPTP